MSPCNNCHKYMDPIGFGFLNYDATGAYQATDSNGQTGTFPPVDASGQIGAMSTGEFSTTFTGPGDLVNQLSTATQTKQCFALQELRYALSRMESFDDACSAQQIYSAFSSGKFNIQQLLLAIVASNAFLNRSAFTVGSSCQ
jgi:hypothetical protein